MDQRAIRLRVEEAYRFRGYVKRGQGGQKNLQELCDAAGWDKGNFSRLMNPRQDFGSITAEMMLRLAAALNVRIAWLLAGDGPMLELDDRTDPREVAQAAIRIIDAIAPSLTRRRQAIEEAVHDELRNTRESSSALIAGDARKRRQK